MHNVFVFDGRHRVRDFEGSIDAATLLIAASVNFCLCGDLVLPFCDSAFVKG